MATKGASGALAARSRQKSSMSPITSTPAARALSTAQCGAGCVSGTPGASTSAAKRLQSAAARSLTAGPSAAAASQLRAVPSPATTAAPPASSARAVASPERPRPKTATVRPANVVTGVITPSLLRVAPGKIHPGDPYRARPGQPIGRARLFPARFPPSHRGRVHARKLPMPADLHLTGHTHETKLAGLAQRQPITDTKVGGVIAGTRSQPRQAFAAREERLECLVQATQHLLFYRERPARELGRRAAHALELVGLHLVADRNAASAVGRNALLETGVVELAEVREHVAEGGGLRPGRLDAVLVAQHGHGHLP